MSDIVYSVVIDVSQKGSLGDSSTMSKLGAMEGAVGKISDAATTMGSKLAGAFEGAMDRAVDLTISMGKLAVVAGAGAITYGVAGLNAELEKTQISLASIFTANGAAENINKGFDLAGKTMADMRTDAAALPGEFKDLVGIFKDISVPGFQAGKGIDQLEKLSAKTMSVSSVLGLNMEQAGREMAMLLEGRAGAHNVLGMRMAGLGGDKAQAFNKLSGGQRFDFVTKELAKFGDAESLFAKSFDGLSSTMKDNGKHVLQMATAPLFAKVKDSMAGGNKWFDENQDKIGDMTTWIGSRLAWAWDRGTEMIEKWGPALVTFAEHAYTRITSLFQRIEPYLDKLGGKFGKMLADPEGTLDKMGSALSLYAAMKVAGPLGGMGKLAGGLGGAELGMGAAGGGLIAAGAMALFTAEVAGAIHAITDEAALMHSTAVYLGDDITEKFGRTQEAFSKMEPSLVKVGDLIGVMFLSNVDMMMTGVANLTEGISALATTMDSEAKKMWNAVGLGMPDMDRTSRLGEAGDFGKGTRRGFEGAERLGVDAKRGTPGIPSPAGVHIENLHLEMNVSGNNDPSRVARIVSSHLSNMSRNPRVSPYVPNYSSR